jgi:hypothetical protein
VGGGGTVGVAGTGVYVGGRGLAVASCSVGNEAGVDGGKVGDREEEGVKEGVGETGSGVGDGLDGVTREAAVAEASAGVAEGETVA